MMRRTDGRTDTRPLHRPCCTYYGTPSSCHRHILHGQYELIADLWNFRITLCIGENAQNMSVFSLVNSADNMTLPTLAADCCAVAPLLLGARHSPLSINISCPHGAQQQTRCTPLLSLNDETDRHMKPLHRPCSAYYAGSTNKQAENRHTFV